MTCRAWELDPANSSIQFGVRHMLVSKARGHFRKWSGSLAVDEGDHAQSSVEVRIDAASIDTAEPTRDAHLRTSDFLAVDRFPHLVFKSTRVERRSEKHLSVTGDLTIRGITRPVVLEVERAGPVRDPRGLHRIGFSARTVIDRRDFGITINQVLDLGGFVLGDRVEVEIEVQATRAAPERPRS